MRHSHDSYSCEVNRRGASRAVAWAVVVIGLLLAVLLVPFVVAYWSDSYYQAQINEGLSRVLYAVGAITVVIVIMKYVLPAYNDHQDRAVAREEKRRYLSADAQGLYPLPKAHIEDRTYERALMLATVLKHIPEQGRNTRAIAPAIVEPDVPELASLVVPTFGDLLNTGRVGKGNPLLLGIETTDSSELSGSWLDLYATAVGGLPGSGKTTSQRFYAAQSALHGAKFVVVDPHLGATDDSLGATLAPLGDVYLCEPASEEKQILQAVKLVADIGEKRIKGQDQSREPVILWIDELTALLNHSKMGPELAMLLERIAQQYRKRFVYGSYSGQIWSASRTGDDSALRDSLASVLAHRMKRSQARMLLPLEEARMVERLEPGRAVLWRTSGAVAQIAIPNTTAGDVRRVAGLLTADAPTIERLQPGYSSAGKETIPVTIYQPESSQKVAEAARLHSAPGSSTTASPEARRAAELFMSGMTRPADLVRELRGVSSNQGARYQVALTEVMELVRQGIAGA